MKTVLTLMTITAVFGLMIAAGIAADDQSQSTSRPQDQSYSSPRPGTGTSSMDQNSTTGQQGQISQDQTAVPSSERKVERLSQLRDLKATNNQNEDLGKIKDFVIDKRQGKIAYAVLYYGGMAGIGEKKFAIPWQALSLTPDAKNFTLNVPKQHFEQAQGFKDQWPAQADYSFISGGMQSKGHQYQGGQYGSQEGTPGPQSRGNIWSRNELSKQHPWLERSSEIIGQDVVNMQDEDIGEIEDLMVDTKQGKIDYAVLSHGGFLAMGEKLVPVPWRALQIRSERNQLVLDVTKDKLNSAPSFEKSNWPDMSDPQWQQNVHSYFGMSQTGSAGYYGQQQGSWNTGGQQQTVEGKIVNVSQYSPERGMAPIYRVKLRTNEGKTVHVQLGPKSALDQQSVELKAGDQLRVTGSMTKSWGRETVRASSIEYNGKTIPLSGQQDQQKQQGNM